MTAAPERGRLFLVTGGTRDVRAGVAGGLAAHLDRAVAVDCSVFDRMIVSGRVPATDPPTLAQVRQLLLRWSAGIATAETYQLEGYDAVVTDDLHGDHLEDFLDLVSPEPVLLVVLDDGSDAVTPHWGLWLDGAGRQADDLAEDILARLDDALVLTTEERTGHP